MSIKVAMRHLEIEERIKNMNKSEVVGCMLGYLSQAEASANDNKNVIFHSCLKIKEKLQSTEKELFILETIGVKDKRVGKEYLIKELKSIEERINNIWKDVD
jgi:uncharacterized protein YbgA (DUF1722 family)